MTPDLKATSQLRLQHLKNRDGVVVDTPSNIFVDLERGFTLSEIAERTTEEMTQVLQQIQI